jgi:hypothetical protein
MRMKVLIYIGIFIFLLLAIIYIYTAQKFGINREQRFYTHFDTTDIYGKLEYAKIGYHGVVFKVIGINEEFIFYPYTSMLNNNKIFYNLAERGGLIIKPKHSDTLRLQKDDVIYLYTFRKFK